MQMNTQNYTAVIDRFGYNIATYFEIYEEFQTADHSNSQSSKPLHTKNQKPKTYVTSFKLNIRHLKIQQQRPQETKATEHSPHQLCVTRV